MTTRYSVYRGPGRRLVAISESLVSGTWVVKTGVQGKRLRSTTVNQSDCPSYSELKQQYLTPDYEHLYTETIDLFGQPLDPSSSLVYWSANDIDTAALEEQLRSLLEALQQYDVPMQIVDDLSGIIVTIGQNRFGLSRARVSDCIHYDGSGAGYLPTPTAADLLSVISLLSESTSIQLADSDGQTMTRAEVMNRCGNAVSDQMAHYLSDNTEQSLTISLRTMKGKYVAF